MKIPVKGLKQLYLDDLDEYLFYNDELLKAGIYFKYTCIEEEKPEDQEFYKFTGVVEVIFFEEREVDNESFVSKAWWSILFWNDDVEPIQLYRIIKDIYDLFLDNTFHDFFEIIADLSVSRTGSGTNKDVIAHTELELDFIYSNGDF